jgi:tripartite ATP-independent transporter DctP family solute receptor
MSITKRTLLRGIGGASALIASGLPVRAQSPIKLRLAHSGQEAETQHLAALEFSKLAKERSNGQLQIQVYGASALGNDNTAVAGTRGGTIDFVLSGNPYFTGIVPRLNVLDLPYIFASSEHAYKVLDGSIGRGLLDEMEAHNMKGLAFLEVGFRNLTNSRRAVKTPDDVKGLKLRTTPNPAHIKAFQLLGANPAPMPIAEVYTALENKAIDGQENPATIVRNAKFYEVQKYMSMTRHAYTAEPLVMNKERFASLPAPLQQALLDAAKGAATFHRELNRKSEAADIAYLRANGMQVEEKIDAEPFRKLVAEPVKQLFAEKNGVQLVEAVQKAI